MFCKTKSVSFPLKTVFYFRPFITKFRLNSWLLTIICAFCQRHPWKTKNMWIFFCIFHIFAWSLFEKVFWKKKKKKRNAAPEINPSWNWFLGLLLRTHPQPSVDSTLWGCHGFFINFHLKQCQPAAKQWKFRFLVWNQVYSDEYGSIVKFEEIFDNQGYL